MIIGSYPEYQNYATQNSYSYYNQNPIIYRSLERAGWAQFTNNNVMYDSISSGKNIVVTYSGDLSNMGVGLREELDILASFHYPISNWLSP
jgi:hypothetical protein